MTAQSEADGLQARRVHILSALVADCPESQAAIAAKAKMSPSHLSHILNGQVCPSTATFERILRATGATPQVVWLALISEIEHVPLITRSDFLARLIKELPARLLEHVGQDLLDADPRWANGIIEIVINKTLETVERKRQNDELLAQRL